MSWRDNIQICMDVPTEVCNAKGGNCDECSIDRVLEALKAQGKRLEGYRVQTPIGGMPVNQVDIITLLDTNLGKGWLIFIPEEAE